MARIAGRQRGLVTSGQLAAIGLDRSAIARRVAGGRLFRVHRGVYAVGHPHLATDARYLAAVLACGPGAVVSHGAAAHLLGIGRGPVPWPEVTAPGFRRPAGIVVHESRGLHPLDRADLDGIPVTPVPRTLLDLAGSLPLADLARAFHEAHVRHRTTPAQVEAAIARTPNRKGVAALREAMYGESVLTLSRLEDQFLVLLRRAGLPLPQTNRVRNGDRVDCRWPQHRLTVELLSFRFHATRRAWEEDLRRERRAVAAGDRHRRYPWGDVFERPAVLVAELDALLR